MDYAEAGPRIQNELGVDDIGKAIRIYESNKSLFDAIFAIGLKIPGMIGNFFHKKVKDVTNENPPQSSSGPIETPKPLKKKDDEVSIDRIPTQLVVRYFFIERKRTPYKEGGGRYILPKDEFMRIISSSDPLQAGDRVHIDITPIDQFGVKFEKDQAANQQLLNSEGDPAMKHVITGGIGELTSSADDFGCTPVILIPWENPEVKPGFEGWMGYSCEFEGIKSNVLPNLRVKPWKA